MDLRDRTKQAVKEARAAIALDDDQAGALARIIERAIVDSVQAASRHSQKVARACCEADDDMAHKLAREIERANVALIANLSAMR